MSQILAGQVLSLAKSQPQKPAVLFKKETLSYKELADQVIRCGTFLSGLGIQRKDRVLFTALSKPEAVVIYLGIQYAGAIAVAMDKNATAENAWQIYADTDASMFVTDRPCGEYQDRMRLFSLRELYAIWILIRTGNCLVKTGLPGSRRRRPLLRDKHARCFLTGSLTGKTSRR